MTSTPGWIRTSEHCTHEASPSGLTSLGHPPVPGGGRASCPPIAAIRPGGLEPPGIVHARLRPPVSPRLGTLRCLVEGGHRARRSWQYARLDSNHRGLCTRGFALRSHLAWAPSGAWWRAGIVPADRGNTPGWIRTTGDCAREASPSGFTALGHPPVPGGGRASCPPIAAIRPGGLEPPTLGLEIPCSIRLSYGREGVATECDDRGTFLKWSDCSLPIAALSASPRAAGVSRPAEGP